MARILVGFLVIVSGCGFSGIPTLATKSNFQEFELTRSAGLGFCIDTGMVLHALIRRNETGARIESLQIVREAPDWADFGPCAEGSVVSDYGCISVVDIEPHDLTESELGELKKAFRWMHVRVGSFPFLFYDPCILTTFRWDNFEAHSGSAGVSLNEQDQNEIESVLLSLAEN